MYKRNTFHEGIAPLPLQPVRNHHHEHCVKPKTFQLNAMLIVHVSILR